MAPVTVAEHKTAMLQREAEASTGGGLRLSAHELRLEGRYDALRDSPGFDVARSFLEPGNRRRYDDSPLRRMLQRMPKACCMCTG